MMGCINMYHGIDRWARVLRSTRAPSRWPRALHVAAAAPIAWLGCSTESASPEPCTPEIGAIERTVLEPHCSAAGCHGAAEPPAGLVLVGPAVESALVGVPSTDACAGWIRVVPGFAEASLLYRKLAGPLWCGQRMPPGGSLPAEDIACVRQWIEQVPGGPCNESGLVCGAGQECIDGACVCTADIMVDPLHCGACGNPCAPGQFCVAGVCTCGAPAPVSLSGDVQPIFTASCAKRTCHGAALGEAPADLVLLAGAAHSALVDVASTECGASRRRVSPGQPSESYVVDKVMGVQFCGDGTSMPPDAPLPESSIRTIVDWICAGARDD